MKIKALRISGFRGIPPIDPPDLALDLARNNDEPKDLLLFGPNAYGKSSIADAIEWFFKEQVRGSKYFHEYTQRDTVHLQLGYPNCELIAYIEMDVWVNGATHTIRKEINANGVKCGENLGTVATEVEQLRDEVIVLDHDQFRTFVASANAEKWSTFSSLIGYEGLDHFRSGLSSLTSKTLTDALQLSQKENELKAQKTRFNNKLQETLDRFEEAKLGNEEKRLQNLHNGLQKRLEVLLTSLGRPTQVEIDTLTASFWNELRKQMQQGEVIQDTSTNIAKLQSLLDLLVEIPDSVLAEVRQIERDVKSLAKEKNNFDKKILADFYAKGLEVMVESKASADLCPLCETPYDWSMLTDKVQNRLQSLNFAGISQQQQSVQQAWVRVRPRMQQSLLAIQRVDLTTVKDAYLSVTSLEAVERSLSMTTFDEQVISTWKAGIIALNHSIQENKILVQQEFNNLKAAMPINPLAHLAGTIERLALHWQAWTELVQERSAIVKNEGQYRIYEQVVTQLRDIATNFRTELSDFSGRVVTIINTDVQRYYDALHLDDNVQPYLEVALKGNQRIVDLKCRFKGIPDKAAVTLMSESHRNSLGFAIFLAFMKYKRQTGSPIEFCVLDDVTQSFDTGHRASLINLLTNPNFPEISQQQILFFTHDRTLADYIKRPSEDSKDWQRYDIRSWQLHNMHVEPHSIDLLARAHHHVSKGDELAAAVYGRHALEQVYRDIVESAGVLMPYNSKPWTIKLDKYEEAIVQEVETAWQMGIQRGSTRIPGGLIDPQSILMSKLRQSVRILHLTVHDSDFLDNQPSLGDIQTALRAIEDLRDKFTCPTCRSASNPEYRYFSKLRKDNQGNPHKCRVCRQPFPCDPCVLPV